METLFDESEPYSKYKAALYEALDAPYRKDDDEHRLKCVAIHEDKIKPLNKRILIRDRIIDLYFVYVDYDSDECESRYWFFIGKIHNDVVNKDIYFVYESECCYTGFGFCEEPTLSLSTSQDLLKIYGLTDKHRTLINENSRFTIKNQELYDGFKHYFIPKNLL